MKPLQKHNDQTETFQNTSTKMKTLQNKGIVYLKPGLEESFSTPLRASK